MHNSEIVPTHLSNEKPETQVNIYAKLASLPKDISDKITNSKTNGGRSLDAVWSIKNISSHQKLVLMYLGSRMTYSYNQFADQYQFVSLNKIEGIS
jgi:hypothetical protein